MPVSVYGADYFVEILANRDIWLALLTVAPSSTDTGSMLDEPTGASYGRIYLDPVNWSVADSGVVTFDTSIIYIPTEDWGPITYYALCDAVADGQMYFYEMLNTTIDVKAGSTLVLDDGLISLEVL